MTARRPSIVFEAILLLYQISSQLLRRTLSSKMYNSINQTIFLNAKCVFTLISGVKVVYKRYASLYFAMCIDTTENELDMFGVIHNYVELLDKNFGSVCELDIVFEFQVAYQILDEVIIAGHLQESSQEKVTRETLQKLMHSLKNVC